MTVSRQGRTRLFAIEGPAGAGKSMLVSRLADSLPSNQLSVVSEFTTSPLGSLLCTSSHFGTQRRAWQASLGGLLAYLGDKVAGVETAARAGFPLAIADRSHLTQWVLSVPHLPVGADWAVANSIWGGGRQDHLRERSRSSLQG